ncbi:MAG: hypothetical protein JWN70_4709 [Planctomycetaceae bacterium]|nr:hypothetical protein [Planctomycetaceae bacterium]
MGFLSGRITCERFRITSEGPRQFAPEHLDILIKHAIGQLEPTGDGTQVGFLAGEHLFDTDFQWDKAMIDDTLHCAVRIDTNKIPSPLKKAWLQMELAVLAAENPNGRPTKTQKQEAKESVEKRCEEELKTGRYRRMQQFPVLWDARDGILYVGTSSPASLELCINLFADAFELSFEQLTSGKLASEWAVEDDHRMNLAEADPTPFHTREIQPPISWHNQESGNFDYLGNEFLLWLWWYLESQSDTISLADDTEVTAMIVKTLRLECPRGESGKDTITHESPVTLPEAHQAVLSGKLPRKAGLILSRLGEQYDFVLQAEMISINGAKIENDEGGGRGPLENRIQSIRHFSETLDLLFGAFFERRLGKTWSRELEQIRNWLQAERQIEQRGAA